MNTTRSLTTWLALLSLPALLALPASGDDAATQVAPEAPTEAAAEATDRQATEATEATQPARGEPYIVPAGRSPIPQPGEGFARPIPLERLEPEHRVEAPSDPIHWRDAHRYVGHHASVDGKVVATGNIGTIAFLNFAERRFDEDFTVVVFSDAFEGIPDGKPEVHFADKAIRVTGPITTHRGRAQIQVRDASQVQIIDEADLATPAAADASPAPAPGSGTQREQGRATPRPETSPPATPGDRGRPASGEAVPWREAPNRMGETITIRGRVIDTHQSSTVTFLNFSPERDSFYIVIFADALAQMPEPAHAFYLNRTIEVTGRVSEHRDRPQIQVRDPAQIVVVE
jgi:DNA/RNA endonuclease YhcR with UshA esterase domain